MTLIFFACTSDTEDIPKVAPSGLVYSETNVTFVKGSTDKVISVTSVEKGSSDIQSYAFLTSITGILINSANGTITIGSAVAVGNYTLSIDVENSHLTTTFKDLITIVVEAAPPSKPSNLIYNTARLLLVEGTVGSITRTSVNNGGSTITEYASIGSLPNGFVVNSATGDISITIAAVVGVHKLSITVTNSAGSTNFNNVVTVVIGESNTFNGQIKALFVSKCSPCHTSDATGQSWDFTVYANAKSHINQIITKLENGSMPKNAAALPQSEIDQIKLWLIGGLLEN